MKNIILSVILLTSVFLFGQTGINTQYTEAAFHVDGKKDNPTTGIPSKSQQYNDFLISSQGLIGVGTDSPSARVEINSATSGALKIVDGTQGNNKFLTSDANGVGQWKSPAITSITGVTPTSIRYYGDEINSYMGAYIDLPQGKWFVNLGFLVNGAAGANIVYTSRLTLSNSDTALANTKLSSTGFEFINNNSTVLSQISNGDGDDDFRQYGMFSSGIIRVEVKVPLIRLYLWNDKSYITSWNTKEIFLNNNAENYFFAIKAN